MRALIAAALALVLFGSLPVDAEEVRLGVVGSIEYDSNLFNAPESELEIDDTAIRVGPLLALRRSQGSFTYQIRYAPRWEYFIDQSADDVWDHNAFLNAQWQISPRTTLRASNRFLITRSLNRSSFISDPTQPDVGPTPDIEVARQRITRNLAAFSAEHQFTERLEGILDLRHDLFITDRDDRFDSQTAGVTARSLYVLRPTDRIGGGAGFTWQRFEDTTLQPGSETLFYRLFASWVHQFDPTFTFTVNAGPTFIDQSTRGGAPTSAIVPAYPSRATTAGGVRTIDSASCPTNDDDVPYVADTCGLLGAELSGADAAFVRGTSTQVFQGSDAGDPDIRTTIFATADLTKMWRQWRASLRYQRSDSTASGVGQATILDFVSAFLIWTPDDRWESRFDLGWTNRQSATNQTGNSVGLGPPEAIAFPPPSTTLAAGSPAVSLVRVQSDDIIDVQTWTTGLRVARRFGRWSQGWVQFRYLRQDFDGETSQRDFDDYRVAFGVRWLMDWKRPW